MKISLDELVQAGAHFGHRRRRWNPKMSEYIYGEQDGVHIFDLTKTKESLEIALEFLKTAKKAGKVILFVGTKKQVKEKIKDTAVSVGMPYINERWLGGTITNFEQIKKSIDKLRDMKTSRDLGEFQVYTKKERLLLNREIERLEKLFGGISELKKIPDVVFIVDIKKEATAVYEATKKAVPTVAIVDSNSDPDMVDYPIPMNDDATRALEYVLDLVSQELGGGKSAEKETPAEAAKSEKPEDKAKKAAKKTK